MATKDYSSKQESMVAEYLGWKTVVGSGARDFHYGDIVDLEWLGECKTHIRRQKQIKFLKQHWEKLKEEALFHHKNPVLITDNGTQHLVDTYCLFKTRFDTVDIMETLGEIIQIEYKDVNIILQTDELNVSKMYSVKGFDPIFTVYICSVAKFKDMLENG